MQALGGKCKPHRQAGGKCKPHGGKCNPQGGKCKPQGVTASPIITAKHYRGPLSLSSTHAGCVWIPVCTPLSYWCTKTIQMIIKAFVDREYDRAQTTAPSLRETAWQGHVKGSLVRACPDGAQQGFKQLKIMQWREGPLPDRTNKYNHQHVFAAFAHSSHHVRVLSIVLLRKFVAWVRDWSAISQG
jgi:hypothetical protein